MTSGAAEVGALPGDPPGWARLDAQLVAERAGAGIGPLGSKARRLAIASRRGLPVPAGGVLLDEAWHLPDHAVLFAAVRGVVGSGPIAVRSAFTIEDGDTRSFAGAFETELGVDASGDDSIEAAWSRVRESVGRVEQAAAVRRDVLVQQLVAARHAGVAFTEPDFADDLVEFVEGLGDDLVSGRRRGSRVELPKQGAGGGLGTAVRPAAEQRACLVRLQQLLHRVRRCFGSATGWDVEWADDGRICWLLQVRPVTASPGRDEIFTAANHKEILPDPPSRLMTSVMAECAVQLYGWYRRFDRRLPARRAFLEVFHGRPRINLSLLVDTMRHLGLPTRLVTDSIGAGGAPQVPLRPAVMLRRLPALLRMGWAQAGAARVARRTGDQLVRQAELDAVGGLGAVVDGLGTSYVQLVHAMFATTAAMSIPLAILRRLGVLHEHSRRHRSVTSRVFVELEELRGRLAAAPTAVTRALAAGELPAADPGWHAEVAAFLARHAHRGPFESDVASPRFAERPAALLKSLAAAPTRRRPVPVPVGRRLLTFLTSPLWWMARGPLAAREALRDRAMLGFTRLRAALQGHAEQAVRAGSLPDAAAIFDLEAGELRELAAGRTSPPTNWRPVEATGSRCGVALAGRVPTS